MEVVYPVNVNVDGVRIGEGTIKLIDEYQDDVTQRVVSRSVSGKVVVDSVVVGSASGSYEDYVTYGTGGTRTVNIPVRTFIDSILLSLTQLTHIDRYGAVVSQQRPYPKPIHLIPFLLPLVFFIVIAMRRREEE